VYYINQLNQNYDVNPEFFGTDSGGFKPEGGDKDGEKQKTGNIDG
jgi:hypothetical protein